MKCKLQCLFIKSFGIALLAYSIITEMKRKFSRGYCRHIFLPLFLLFTFLPYLFSLFPIYLFLYIHIYRFIFIFIEFHLYKVQTLVVVYCLLGLVYYILY